MKDPSNPTPSDVRQWAYDPDTLEPVQDFHIFVWQEAAAEVLVEFASDPACPKQSYFLWCLYGKIGDEVRSNGHEENTWTVVAEHVDNPDPDIARWAQRSLTLRSQPELFVYDDWCWGDLRRIEDPWP